MTYFRLLFILAGICLIPSFLAGAILSVPSPTYPDLTSAITAASSGDTIQVAAGIYYGNFVIPSTKHHLVLMGTGGSLTTPSDTTDDSILDAQLSGTTLSISGSNIVVEGFSIINGRGGAIGGNVDCFGDSNVIKLNLIENGATTQGGGYGGGIVVSGSNHSKILFNRIVNCWAWNSGGGISVQGSKHVQIIGNYLEGNQADWAGGLQVFSDSVSVIGNIFIDNYADFRDGGGMRITVNQNAVIANNIFYDNTAIEWGVGGAIYATVDASGILHIINNVIANNHNDRVISPVGGIYINAIPSSSIVNIDHNLFFGNQGNDVQGWTMGNSNLFQDPLFQDPANKDFQLTSNSPAIDAGQNTISGSILPSFDYAMNDRIKNGIVDIGVYEYNSQTYDPFSMIIQPADQFACEGDSAALVFQLNSSAPISFQWQKDGINLPGETDSLLFIQPVSITDVGIYTCRVSDGYCKNITSMGANLSMESKTSTINSQPDDQIVCPGAQVNFTFDAFYVEPHSFQWQKDGIDLQGQTQSTLTLTQVDSTHSGIYTCIMFTPNCFMKTSDQATLFIETNDLTIDPLFTDTLVATGTSLDLVVQASSGGSPSYQWQKNGVDLPGETDSVLSFPSISLSDSGFYRCILSSEHGCFEIIGDSIHVMLGDFVGNIQISNVQHLNVFPTPFVDHVQIEFELLEASPVRLPVFNLEGKQLGSLYDGLLSPGIHRFSWDGKNAFGQTMSSGLYICQMRTRKGHFPIKLIKF